MHALGSRCKVAVIMRDNVCIANDYNPAGDQEVLDFLHRFLQFNGNELDFRSRDLVDDRRDRGSCLIPPSAEELLGSLQVLALVPGTSQIEKVRDERNCESVRTKQRGLGRQQSIGFVAILAYIDWQQLRDSMVEAIVQMRAFGLANIRIFLYVSFESLDLFSELLHLLKFYIT